jgi:predicted nuclease of predicted toxin-antitoxin system
VKFVVDSQLPIAFSYLLKHRGYDAFHKMELPDSNSSSVGLITSIIIEENRVVITKGHNFLESYLIIAQRIIMYWSKRIIFIRKLYYRFLTQI